MENKGVLRQNQFVRKLKALGAKVHMAQVVEHRPSKKIKGSNTNLQEKKKQYIRRK
jgi:hypothetical protein